MLTRILRVGALIELFMAAALALLLIQLGVPAVVAVALAALLPVAVHGPERLWRRPSNWTKVVSNWFRTTSGKLTQQVLSNGLRIDMHAEVRREIEIGRAHV